MARELIGLDLGTSYIKAARFDEGGRQRAISTRPVSFHQDGTVEAESVRQAAETCLKEVGTKGVAAVGCSAAMHTLLWVGPDLTPLTGVGTWMDAGAQKTAEALRREGVDWWRRTGMPVHASSPAVRILDARKRGAAPAGRPMALKDWLMACWTGRPVTDLSTAAASGLLSRRERAWDPQVLEALGLSEGDLPELSSADHIAGDVLGMPLAVGTTDGLATHLGLGAGAGEASLSLGTSGAVRRLVPERGQEAKAHGLFAYAADGQRTLIGGALSDAGNLLDWWGGVIGRSTPQVLAEALSWGRPEGDLMAVPFVHGTRSPIWREDERGALLGIGAASGRAALSSALVEGILLTLALVADDLGAALGPQRAYRAAGGLFRAGGLGQWAADVLGAPLWLQSERDPAVLGAARLAASACGEVPPEGPPPVRISPRRPRPERRLAQLRALLDKTATGGIDI